MVLPTRFEKHTQNVQSVLEGEKEMSNDPLTDHLEMMSGMLDRHHNQPAAYFDAYEFDGNDQNGGVPCEGNGGRLLTESPSNFEMEAEDVVLDRLHLELKASWEALRHTNAGEVGK